MDGIDSSKSQTQGLCLECCKDTVLAHAVDPMASLPLFYYHGEDAQSCAWL